MGFTISSVVELVRPKPASLLSKASCDVIVILRILVRLLRHGDDLSAENAEQTQFFGRLGFGNDDGYLVTPGVTNHGKTDPRVTGGALDDRCAWLEQTALLGIGDDPVGRTILYRAAGIHEFRFSQNLAACQFG